MYLKDLIEILNENASDDAKKDMPVVIFFNEPSIGTSSYTGISGAFEGFDWNHGKFFMFPSEPLVRENFNKGKTTKIFRKYGINEVYSCGSCGIIVKKEHRYCCMCGKQFSENKKEKE